MVVSDIVRGFLILAFIIVVLAGTESLWPIYIIGFLTSAVGAFFLPARSATIPNIVPRNGLLSANSLSQTSFVLSRVLGTAAAGLIIGLFDVFWLAFVVDAATFFASALLISQIRLPHIETVSYKELPLGENIKSAFRELGEGLNIIARSRALMGTLVAAGVAMLGIGAVNVLLPPFIVNDIGLSETWFGVINIAQVAGMLISGTVVAVLAARFRPTHLISIGLVALGVATSALAAAYQLWQLLIILFAIGLSAAPINASIATLIQATVEDRMRGRIMAALGAMVQVTSIVSMLAAGLLAVQLGTRTVFFISGIIAVAAGVLSAWVYKGFTLPRPEYAESAALKTSA
jgi:MFS family permease